MVSSLKALLGGIIDYAGLFPPASLSMEQSLRKYAAYLNHDRAWLLSHFVCPAIRLSDIERFSNLIYGEAHESWRLSIIGSSGKSLTAFLQALQDDFVLIKDFVSREDEGRVFADLYEVRVPDRVIADGYDAVLELAERSGEIIASKARGNLELHLEIAMIGQELPKVAEALRALRSFNDSWSSQRFKPYSTKIRLGGLTAEDVPQASLIAFYIRACEEVGLSMKATAGLHHPLPRIDPQLNIPTHGFLNLFAACAFAYALQCELPDLVRVLTCAEISEFEFSEEGLSFRNLEVSTAQITKTRQKFISSYGSCSFEDPVDGLEELGLLREA